MMEVHWGAPLRFTVTTEGDTISVTTIESARWLLERKWPVADESRMTALRRIDQAMECLAPVAAAREAFVSAAQTAGYHPA
ncbi:DUF982 domain-containing protein [Falsigemmobacter intermedius]|uniref:DUF982 domain-containing protein n=3 Tax=Falsigemmobacter intermedius TaxID=1553448 RepID=A0A444M9J8_9RHOB|nr:DUF982 domain-containing protein [Falsigemmobacter intermedius]